MISRQEVLTRENFSLGAGGGMALEASSACCRFLGCAQVLSSVSLGFRIVPQSQHKVSMKWGMCGDGNTVPAFFLKDRACH